MKKGSFVVWLGSSARPRQRLRPVIKLVQPSVPVRSDGAVAFPSPAETPLLLEALSLFDAALDECAADEDQRAMEIIDRLAVEVLACIRQQSTMGPAVLAQPIPNEAWS